jgi:peroxiredoxin
VSDPWGCTATECSLGDSYEKLHAQGLQIIGVNLDQNDTRKPFQEQNKQPFTLVVDRHGKVGEAFDVPTYGGGDTPIVYSHGTFIIKDGRIAWNSLTSQTECTVAEVQKALDGLK